MATILESAEKVGAEHRLGPLGRIPVGEGRRYVVEGEEIAVFRTRTGGLFAVQAVCTHRGGPLADGLIGQGRVVCPLHGFAFELETGDSVQGTCTALRTYPVEIDDTENIVVRVAPDPCRNLGAQHPCGREDADPSFSSRVERSGAGSAPASAPEPVFPRQGN